MSEYLENSVISASEVDASNSSAMTSNIPETGANTSKKKRNRETESKRLTFKEKLQILEMLDSGMTQSSIAKMFKRNQASIAYLKSNKDNILKHKKILEKRNMDLNIRRFSKVIESDLDKKLSEWFIQKRAEGEAVSGRKLQKMAIVFNKMLNGPANFAASNGYLQSFQKRHGIWLGKQEEKTPTDTSTVNDFQTTFRKKVDDFGYGIDQIYNAAASSFLWKLLPTDVPVEAVHETPSDCNFAKDQVTVMICANGSGTHRIPLFMVGKPKHENCINGLNMQLLPVTYASQKNGRMDSSLFMQWYTEVFLPEITKKYTASGLKCLLLLDNSPIHPPEHVLNKISDICTVAFLSSNDNSLIQPMEQGVIKAFKRSYRKHLLNSILLSEDNCNLQKFIKDRSMYNCIMLSSKAWNSLSQDILTNAWNAVLGISPNQSEDDQETNVLSNIIAHIPGFHDVSPEQIERWIQYSHLSNAFEEFENQPSTSGCQEPEDETSETENSVVPSSLQALKAFEDLQKWMYSRTEFTTEQLMTFNSMHQIIADVALNDVLCTHR